MDSSLDALKQIYKASAAPVALADGTLSALWANEAALKSWPSLHMPDGLRILLVGQSSQELLEHLAEKKSAMVRLDSLLETSGRMSMTLLESGNILVNFFPEEESTGVLNSRGAEQVLAGFSGQFRAPLSVIFSSLTGIFHQLSGLPSDKSSAILDGVRCINQNCYKMLRSCGNITLMGRYLNAISTVKVQRIDFSAHLQELCGAMRIVTEAAGIPLTLQAQPGILLVCDVQKMDLAILNLVSNACNFTRAGNAISIKMELRENRIRILVSDRGAGMAREVLSRAFEPYFSQSPATGAPVGAGLGLPLVRRILNEHKGTVGLMSTAGEGTTVMLSLPAGDRSDLPLTLSEPAAAYLSDRFSPVFVQLCEAANSPLP